MLKPSDKWNWYFDEQKACLMLDLGGGNDFPNQFIPKIVG